MFPKQLSQYILLLLAGIYLSVSQGQQTDNYQPNKVLAANDSQSEVATKHEIHSRYIITTTEFPHRIVKKVLRPLNETDESIKAKDKDNSDIDSNSIPAYFETSQFQITAIHDWDRYNDLSFIYEWMKQMNQKFNLSTELMKIGTTYEKRDIYAFYINKFKPGSPRVKNAIVISAGIYGNEWITTATATYIINELLTSNDERIKKVADAYSWVIIPSLNPDGYEYSFNTDRLWYKNRRNYVGCCPGVDVNREFYETNKFPESDSNVESEIKALDQVFSLLKPVDLFISLEAGKGMILYPHAFKKTDTKKDRLFKVAETAAKALAEIYGTEYKARKDIWPDLYSRDTTSGSMDWAYKVHDALAFTYKLRLADHPVDAIGGTVPIIKILPTAVEIFHSVVAMVNKVQQIGLFPHRKYFT